MLFMLESARPLCRWLHVCNPTPHPWDRCDKAGIQIRGEDGVLDGLGNVAGHGTDPTGKVGDIAALAKAVSQSGRASSWVTMARSPLVDRQKNSQYNLGLLCILLTHCLNLNTMPKKY